MQAADLLAVIAPNAAQGAANGVAGGKPGLDKASGVAADEAADASNPFAQALAALMAAAPALAQTQTRPVSADGKTAAEQSNATPSAPFAKGLQVAAAAGAQGKGLAKLIDGQSGQTAGEAETAADAAATGAVPTDTAPTVPQTDVQLANAPTPSPAATGKALGKTGTDDGAPVVHTPHGIGKGLETAPGQVKKLAAQAPAAEPTPAPDTDLASADPQAAIPAGDAAPDAAGAQPSAQTAPSATQVADAAAKPPQTPAPTPAATASAAPPADTLQNEAPPQSDPLTPPPALLVEAAQPAPQAGLASGQAAPKPNAASSSPPRATGKALGKASDKTQDSDADSGVHAARGLGVGLETAPGQLKKTGFDASQDDPSIADSPLTQSQAPDAPADASVSPFAGQVREIAAAQAHAVNEKAAAHTVAHLAEQIVSNTEGKSTRFDVQLDPAGLGKVDVKIEINRAGEMSAVMTFDNPQSASELRSRAGELRNALEQSGFDLSKGGLSFEFAGQNGGRNSWDQQAQAPTPSWARASFTDLSAIADAPGLSRHRTIDAGGVDVTI